MPPLPCMPTRGTPTSSEVSFRVTLSLSYGDHGRPTAAEVSLPLSAVCSRLVPYTFPARRGHVGSLHGSTTPEVERRHDQHVEHHRRQQATQDDHGHRCLNLIAWLVPAEGQGNQGE